MSATSPATGGLTIEAFMDHAREVVARGVDAAARDEIGRLLARLAASGTISTEALAEGLHGSAAASTILATDAGALTLMLARFPHEVATPVHDHKSWGVAYVLSGIDRHLRWRRTDDGTEVGRATLVVDDDRELRAGDFVHWADPPDDIHSQQGVGGPAYELVCFGRNPMAALRNYFDPERSTVREAMPQ
jgi:predicted metal-dependent enzyme (double-stranded beta helix superfamily)